MQKRQYIRASSVVLWQLLLFISLASAQGVDSTITFKGSGSDVRISPKLQRKIEGVATLGVGFYDGVSKDVSTLPLQPTLGAELLAYPGGWPTFLFGVHFGFTDPFTSSVVVGIRQPLIINPDGIWKLSTDIGAVFFDESGRKEPIGLGARAALVGRSSGSFTLEYRLATEFRGILANDADPTTSTTRWWVGLEVGAAFTLTSETQALSRKDIVRAEIMPIATAEEISDLDDISSSYRVDEWLEMFWAKRDLTPKTIINEARLEYERRLKRADERFSRPKKLGVSTDPGRILVLYGEPDYVETQSSSIDESYRYEMWIYTGRLRDVSPAVILFEVSGARDWHQIYSNIPGEISGTVPANLPAGMRKWL
jgi:GWxTD domain-containing protein